MIIELLGDVKPTFIGCTNKHSNIFILFATGAECSMYTRSEGIFLQRFPDAKKLQCIFPISGSGAGKVNLCSVYQMPEIKVGDIWIRNLPIVIYPKESSISEIVLASYVFRYIPVTISFDKMRMDLLPKRSSIDCLPKTAYSKKYDCNVLTGTYVLTQEDIN